MPYLGNTAGDRFVASKAATQFSGDGSTTAFTLDHAVGSDEDILVSVDGVIQEPSVAYAVSNGTTLTFTAAPSNNSGNNIFVYYLFRTVGTVGHPSNQALSASTGTFTGDVTIGDASAADKKILFDGNAQDFHIGLDDSTDALTIGLGSALGTTSHMVLRDSGVITKPLNPSFRAMGTTGAYQTTSPVPFPSVTGYGGHNIGSHYNTSNYRFTAPVTGRYLIHLHMGIVRITANNGNGYPYLRINGSPIAYSYVHVPTGTAYHPANITQVFKLEANDYVDVTFGGGNSDYYGNYTELSFSGCLIG